MDTVYDVATDPRYDDQGVDLVDAREHALERVRLSVGILAGVLYERDRAREALEQAAGFDDDAQSTLRRAILALDSERSAQARVALEVATRNAQHFGDKVPAVRAHEARISAAVAEYRADADKQVAEARDLGVDVAEVDDLLAALNPFGGVA